MIGGSIQLGEVIREDALTSICLTMVNLAAQQEGIPLSITSMQGANLESDFGADWYWKLGEYAYLVQAKKLSVAKRTDLASYEINVPQLKRLQVQADLMTKRFGFDVQPIYVFYNFFLGESSVAPSDFGCISVQSEMLIDMLGNTDRLDQQFASVCLTSIKKEDIRPWYRIF